MTYRELLAAMTGLSAEHPGSEALDEQVVVRVLVDDELHVGGLDSDMGRFAEGERDDSGPLPTTRGYLECRCPNIDKGECGCEDDGSESHRGTWRSSFDHGYHISGSEHGRAITGNK